MNAEIQRAWRNYAEARLAHEQLDEAKKEAFAKWRKAEAALVEAMLDGDVSSWNDTSGAAIGTRRQFGIACNADNAELVERWLTDEFGDAEPYKTTKLDKAAVTAKVKAMCEDDGVPVDELPAFLNVKTHPTIRVLGWAKKKQELLT